MGSTLLTLRTILETMIAEDEVNDSSEPTKTQLNTFINIAQRKITREVQPRELMPSTLLSLSITANSNIVSIGTSAIIPMKVWYLDGNNSSRELYQRSFEAMLNETGPDKFFGASVGIPRLYALRGNDIVLDRKQGETASDRVKVDYLKAPTTLNNDTDESDLSSDYDLLIAYESAILFYQRSEEQDNRAYYEQKAIQEKDNLKLALRAFDNEFVDYSPQFYRYTGGADRYDIILQS